jgi:hypothetical protein
MLIRTDQNFFDLPVIAALFAALGPAATLGDAPKRRARLRRSVKP